MLGDAELSFRFNNLVAFFRVRTAWRRRAPYFDYAEEGGDWDYLCHQTDNKASQMQKRSQVKLGNNNNNLSYLSICLIF